MEYNNPGATSFLGVGLWAWPMAMDYDGDGLPELFVGAEDGYFYTLANPVEETRR